MMVESRKSREETSPDALVAVQALAAELAGPSVADYQAFAGTWREAPLHPGDAYLAFAAARGAVAAQRRVRALIVEQAQAVIRKGRGSSQVDPHDLAQRVATKLLVAPPNERPGIESYAGAGPLAAWLRVIAARELVSITRKRSEVVGEESERGALLPASGAGADPEAEFLRGQYRSVFEQAFRRAADQLDVEDRNILRYHYVDGFSIDRIAVIYDLHRASVARRIHKARETLLEATRAALRAENFGSDSELESVLRAVESRVDLSVTKLFGSKPGA
jgi:RNA polymerase sigma-70 factor (ECF subfamily)